MKKLEEATIVIIEDDTNSYMASLDLLKLEGAGAVHARTSGEEALKLVDSLPAVDLFLVDIYLPGETGYDIIGRIRQHPKVKDSKVVALTASVMYGDIRRVREAGFDGFIGKPIRPARFGDQVRQILAGESLWEWR
ncbi:MAG: Polar-differentiation response regulator DivK [Anaerolineae bacterium]|nr:Polar-differentiation response regulator DivK [Anaerolineae bacterium]